MTSQRALLASVLLLGAAAAAAHSPYLLPNFFELSERNHVSVQAAFTERFFIPDVAMRAEGYHVTGPDGQRTALTPIYSKDVAILDVDTREAGTYRISSGLRTGSTRKAVLTDGEWQFFAASAAPAGAVDMQSLTRADVYVSRGTPNDVALAPTGEALELQPLTHPGRLHAGSEARLRVLFNGQPLAGQFVLMSAAGEGEDRDRAPAQLRSGADGIVVLPLEHAGVHHVMVRHRLAPAGAGKPALSYTIALTFDVTD